MYHQTHNSTTRFTNTDCKTSQNPLGTLAQGAILVVVGFGERGRIIHRGSSSDWDSELQDSARGVDDFAVEAVEHPLLQRHRQPGQAGRVDRRPPMVVWADTIPRPTPASRPGCITGDSAVGRAMRPRRAALDGGVADTEVAAAWLDDGIAPNGATGRRVHGEECARLRPDVRRAQERLADPGIDRRWPRRFWPPPTRRPSPPRWPTCTSTPATPGCTTRVTGKKDLHRLPGLVAIAYQHETSRCGDPHLHTHVIVPNRQPRADGELVSIDSKSRCITKPRPPG